MKELFEKYESSIDEVYGLYEVLYNSMMYGYVVNTDDETYCNSYLLDIIREKITLSRELYDELTIEYFEKYERDEFEKKFNDDSIFKENV